MKRRRRRRTQTELLAMLLPGEYLLDSSRLHRDPFGNIWVPGAPGVSDPEQGHRWLGVDGAGPRWINLGHSLLFARVIFNERGEPIGEHPLPPESP